jgi:hypothetical protein
MPRSRWQARSGRRSDTCSGRKSPPDASRNADVLRDQERDHSTLASWVRCLYHRGIPKDPTRDGHRAHQRHSTSRSIQTKHAAKECHTMPTTSCARPSETTTGTLCCELYPRQPPHGVTRDPTHRPTNPPSVTRPGPPGRTEMWRMKNSNVVYKAPVYGPTMSPHHRQGHLAVRAL